MQRLWKFFIECVAWKLKILNNLSSIVLFTVRALIAYIFFSSGVLKLPVGFLGIGEGDWSSTVYLFETDYAVPFLSPELAAYIGTGIEIMAPVLLVLGLTTRLAATAIFVMSLVIEFTYQHNLEHSYWMVLSAVLMTQGAGALSLDNLFFSKFVRSNYQKIH